MNLALPDPDPPAPPARRRRHAAWRRGGRTTAVLVVCLAVALVGTALSVAAVAGLLGAGLAQIGIGSVSYTHLTLPTNREV